MIGLGGMVGQRPQAEQRAATHASAKASSPLLSFLTPRRQAFRFTAYPAICGDGTRRTISAMARDHATDWRRQAPTCAAVPMECFSLTTEPSASYPSATCIHWSRNRSRRRFGRDRRMASTSCPMTISSTVGSGRSVTGSIDCSIANSPTTGSLLASRATGKCDRRAHSTPARFVAPPTMSDFDKLCLTNQRHRSQGLGSEQFASHSVVVSFIETRTCLSPPRANGARARLILRGRSRQPMREACMGKPVTIVPGVHAVRVTRYVCQFCHRGHSKEAAAERHVARCFRNPAAHGCKTCRAYQPIEPSDYGTGYPGCGESCDGGVDISAGLIARCELWEAA